MQAVSGHDGTTTVDSSMAAGACRSVVINTTSCSSLLSSTVARTSGYNIDRMLRLHHQMSLTIYQHRHNYDKTALLQVNLNNWFFSVYQRKQ